MSLIAHLLALLFVFSAVGLAAYNVMPHGVRSLAVRGFDSRRSQLSGLPSLWLRLCYPLLNRMAPAFRAITWESYRSSAKIAIQKAGVGDFITVEHIFAMKLLCTIIIPIAATRLLSLASNPLVFTLIAIGAFYLPDQILKDVRKAREAKILRAMPGSVDVLSLSVEAGLEFVAAIQRLVERGSVGPLRDELATILNDIRLGTSRTQAFKAFSNRVEIPEISSFVSVLVQADMLGASIGPVLQQQAERMRVERFQRAEKAGARATQKILLPLVLFIFPAVLIVVLGPVALQFIYGAR
jgi:tight adherence protein C